MRMKRKITITLEDNDWGQIIDGLACRAEQYELTVQYHEPGYAEDYILEVRDADEARNLAEWYRRLVEQIRKQLRDSREKVQ
ncbi:MAG: hypothetical protein DRP64_05405 [Verrucomicrobia bacterium]|nr:MAG: hypothetical protein DRP64_05405 [Verrucomicrobiota bacterium]